MLPLAEAAITWIKVERPTFDLVGVILGALSLTGFIAAIALGLGAGLGALFIARRRRDQAGEGMLALHLNG